MIRTPLPLRGHHARLVAPVGTVAVLAFWEVLARVHAVPVTLLPPPSSVAAALADRVRTGELVAALGVTMLRVVSGLVIGGSAGLGVGLLMGASRPVREAADPVISALHPVPKLALLPLVMVFLGLGERSKIAIVAAAAFFPMLLNAMAGVRQINRVHFDVARSYGASRRQMLTRVLLPGSVPMVLTGVRLAANIAFLSTIAVEMVSAQTGLGAELWLSWEVLRVDRLFATLAVIALVGVGLSEALRWLAWRGAPWLTEQDSTA